MPVSSEALLGGQARPPLCALCTDRLCQLLTALRHWWSVTTSRGYLSESKRRIGVKASCIALNLFAIIACLLWPNLSDEFNDFRHHRRSGNPDPADRLTNIWNFMDSVILPLIFAAIPYDSLWLDVFIGLWMCIEALIPLIVPRFVFLGHQWLLMALLWMQVGCIHSLAVLPLFFELGLYWAIGKLGPGGCFYFTFSIIVFVMGVVGEWQGASGFCKQQEMNQMTQLLLDQATDGQCTLCQESGTISDATTAFMESLGPSINGAKIFDFVSQGDWAKVTSLLHSRSTLPPSPVLGTFLRRPTLPGAPTIQFEAKILPYALSKGVIHVCLQKVGEERLVEVPAAQPRGHEEASSELPKEHGEYSAHQQDTSPERDVELGTEVSLAISRSSWSRNRRKAATRTVAVQTGPEELSARPPLRPGPPRPPTEPPRPDHARPRHRQARRHCHWVRLNNSKRQVPGLIETPLETRIQRLMDAMDCLNVCGEGCCTFHVSMAAAKQTISTMAKGECRQMFFGNRQCPACFAILIGDEGTVRDVPEDCDSCGKSIYPLTASSPTQSNSGCSSHTVLERNSFRDGSAEFKVLIDRRDGASLGIDGESDGAAFVVHSVTEGLVQQWNESHEEAEVRGGDRLVEVNGIRGNSDRLIAECQRSQLLEIVVHRTASRAQ